MKGLVAVQRKLLEMIYVIYKSKNEYRKNYIDLKGGSALSQKAQYATQTGS